MKFGSYLIPAFIAYAAAASSLCNPLSATNCPAETALATDVTYDFHEESDDFEVQSTPSGISYSDEGLKLTLAKRLDNPSLKSKYYIMFGRVEVSLKAGNGTGIVSSFYLQSNDLDEIDIELIGGDTTQWQSNYFVKGNTDTYDRGAFHNTAGSPQADYHNYTIDWTNEKIVWYYDGTAVRTLSNDSSQGFPQSPMYLMTGIWAGGDPSNEAGTIEWAGGETDYSEAPFAMHINSLKISDYSSGKSYSYGDTSGKWTSIEAKDGEILGRLDSADTSDNDTEDDSSSSSSSSSKKSSSSSSEASSSTAESSSTATSSTAASSTAPSDSAASSEESYASEDSASATESSGDASTSASGSSRTSGARSGSSSGSGSSSDSNSGSNSGSSSSSSSDSSSSSSSSTDSVASETDNMGTTMGASSCLTLAALISFFL